MREKWYNLGQSIHDVSRRDPWALGQPLIQPTTTGGTRLSLAAGASVNCAQWSLVPHAHTTHTETSLHVDTRGPLIGELEWPLAVNATLLRVRSSQLGDTNETGPSSSDASDLVVSLQELTRHVMRLNETAAIVALSDGDPEDGTPPYLTIEAMQWIVQEGVEHLLLEMPSVDRADDNGELLCHRVFWQTERAGTRMQRATITENIAVPRGLPPGTYRLLLQPLIADTDASPSSPLIQPLELRPEIEQ